MAFTRDTVFFEIHSFRGTAAPPPPSTTPTPQRCVVARHRVPRSHPLPLPRASTAADPAGASTTCCEFCGLAGFAEKRGGSRRGAVLKYSPSPHAVPPRRPIAQILHSCIRVAQSPPIHLPGGLGPPFSARFLTECPPPPNVLFEYRKRAGFEDGLPRDLRQQEATWRHDETVSVHGCHRGAHSSRAGLHHASLPK